MKFNLQKLVITMSVIASISGTYINAMELEEEINTSKMQKNASTVHDRIQNVIEILSNKISSLDDSSSEAKDIAENLSSLQGLLDSDKLTEEQMMLFEVIE